MAYTPKEKPGFMLYHEDVKLLESLTDSEFRSVIVGLCARSMKKPVQGLKTPAASMAFDFMSLKVVRDAEAYEMRRAKNSDNAKSKTKGSQANANDCQPPQANANDCQQNEPTVTVTVTGTVPVTETGTGTVTVTPTGEQVIHGANAPQFQKPEYPRAPRYMAHNYTQRDNSVYDNFRGYEPAADYGSAEEKADAEENGAAHGEDSLPVLPVP